METRKITIISTKNHSTKVINSAATTLSELKADLNNAGISYTDCPFFEGLTKTQLTEILTFIFDKMDDVEYFSNINLDNCPYLRDNTVKKETSESPYSSNELNDMFKDI